MKLNFIRTFKCISDFTRKEIKFHINLQIFRGGRILIDSKDLFEYYEFFFIIIILIYSVYVCVCVRARVNVLMIIGTIYFIFYGF